MHKTIALLALFAFASRHSLLRSASEPSSVCLVRSWRR